MVRVFAMVRPENTIPGHAGVQRNEKADSLPKALMSTWRVSILLIASQEDKRGKYLRQLA